MKQEKVLCSECGKVLEPIFKGIPSDPETWDYYICDHCLEPACEECSEVDEETGEVTCSTCYQTIVIRSDR